MTVCTGEYGGIGFASPGHEWLPYSSFAALSPADVLNDTVWLNIFGTMVGKIDHNKQQGQAAAIYTQLTDVEEEINGVLTYDRKVYKISPEQLSNINKMIIGGMQ